MSTSRVKMAVAAGALVLAGAGVGGMAAGTLSAGAATGDSSTSGTATPAPPEQLDPSKSVHPDEQLLTGTTAEKVRAAALAKYPDATIQRVETDSDGVYEAHIVTAAGEELTVQVGKDFAVTGTQTGGPGGRSGFHHHDGDGPDPSTDPST